MTKTYSQSLIAMINASYRIRISTAKSLQEQQALEKEQQRLVVKATRDASSLRWYDFAVLESKGTLWDILSLRKPLNLGSIAMDAMRAKMAGLTKVSGIQRDINRSVEPQFSPMDIAKITKKVFGILVPSDAANDDASTTPAATEVAEPERSFSYTYSIAKGNEPAKTAAIQGFANLDELIEAIADGKRSRRLAEVLHKIRPQSGEEEAVSYKFAALLLEGLGKRMVQPMTNAQFLNLQVYMLEGIKQLRPEIDPDDAYEKFVVELGAHLKAEAKKDNVAEPIMLTDLTNIAPITNGTPSAEVQNRDVLRRSGFLAGQEPAEVVPMYLGAMRLGLVAQEPSLPDRIAKLAKDMAAASGSTNGPNP